MSQRSDSEEGSAQTNKNGDLVCVALDPETKSSSTAASPASESSGHIMDQIISSFNVQLQNKISISSHQSRTAVNAEAGEMWLCWQWV